MTNEQLEELQLLLDWNLVMQSPVMSGNMQSLIQLGGIDTNYAILIQAPFYDLNQWKKKKVIVYTGQSYDGETHYARSVNEEGGFRTHNKSEGWVNRVVNQCCDLFAEKYGGKVVARLPE